VRQIDQYLNSLLNDLVALFAAHARYKTDSAGVMLVRRIVKTLRRWQTVIRFPLLQRDLQTGIQTGRALPVYIFVTAVWG
jgi:hypothetical protein